MEDVTRIQPFKHTALALRAEATGALHALSGEMLVGREVECNIRLTSLKISRYHAKVSVSANGVYLEDLNSSNGTFLNGQRVTGRVRLSLGDQLSFDDLLFRVTTARSGDADSTQLASLQNLPKDIVDQVDQGFAQRGSAPGKSQPFLGETLSGDSINDPILSGEGSLGAAMDNPELQDFLEFAASGLQAQRPLSSEEASPFGLSPKQQDKPSSAPEKSEPEKSEQAEKKAGIKAEQKVGQKLEQQKAEQQKVEQKKPSPPSSVPPKPESLAKPSVKAGPLSFSESVQPEQIKPEPTGQQQAVTGQHEAIADIKPTAKPVDPKPLNSLTSRAQKTQVVPAVAIENDRPRYHNHTAMDRYIEMNEKRSKTLDMGSGPRLVAMTAPIRGKVFALSSDDNVKSWRLGCDDNADVCIRDHVVYHEHAWIIKSGNLYRIRVSDAAPDVAINGVLQREVELKHGDKLQFGAMGLLFRTDEGGAGRDAPGSNGFFSKVKRLFGKSS